MTDPSRYDQLDPLARALVDDYDAINLAAMLVAAQDQLAALRAVARGYCPACGRGDCSPTADQWYKQQQRANKAEAERDTARQHAAAIAAQRDRLRQRMNTLADRWDHALPIDKPYARTLRNEISVAPFHGTSTAVRSYRADDGSQKWAARCWGTDTCDGWLSLDHETERWAEIARDRHLAEDHLAPAPAATEATEHEKTTRVFAALHRSAEQDVSRVIALYERWVKAGPPPLGTSMSRWWDKRLVELHDAILEKASE